MITRVKCDYVYSNNDQCDQDAVDNVFKRCIYHIAADNPYKDKDVFEKQVNEIITNKVNIYQSKLSKLLEENNKLSGVELCHIAAEEVETRLEGFIFPDKYEFPNIEMVNLNLGYSVFNGSLSLEKAKIVGRLDFGHSNIKGQLWLGEINVIGEIWLASSTIEGDLTLINSEVEGELNISGAIIKEDLSLNGARINGDVSISQTEIEGELNIDNAELNGILSLKEAKIGGMLSMEETKVVNDFDLTSVVINGKTFLKEAVIGGKTWFVDSICQKKVDFVASQFIDGMQIEGAQFVGSTSWHQSRISNFQLSRSQFASAVYFYRTIFFHNANIKTTRTKKDDNRIDNLVLFESVYFDRGAIFTSPLFGMPTSFRYTDLTKITFDNADLGFVSFIKCQLSGADFRNCRFINDLEGWPPWMWFRRKYPRILDERLFYAVEKNVKIAVSKNSNVENLRIPKIKKSKEAFKWSLKVNELVIKVPANLEAEFLKKRLWPQYSAGDYFTHPKPQEIIAQYQEIKKNMENRGNPVEAGEYYFAEMEFKRKLRQLNTGLIKRFILIFSPFNLYRLISGYGERPSRPLGWFMALLISCAIGYMHTGIVYYNNNEYYQQDKIPLQNQNKQLIQYEWFLRSPNDHSNSFVHSIVIGGIYTIKNVVPFLDRKETFIKPLDIKSEFVKMGEQFAGSILLGFFFFALRRRFKR